MKKASAAKRRQRRKVRKESRQQALWNKMKRRLKKSRQPSLSSTPPPGASPPESVGLGITRRHRALVDTSVLLHNLDKPQPLLRQPLRHRLHRLQQAPAAAARGAVQRPAALLPPGLLDWAIPSPVAAAPWLPPVTPAGPLARPEDPLKPADPPRLVSLPEPPLPAGRVFRSPPPAATGRGGQPVLGSCVWLVPPSTAATEGRSPQSGKSLSTTGENNHQLDRTSCIEGIRLCRENENIDFSKRKRKATDSFRSSPPKKRVRLALPGTAGTPNLSAELSASKVESRQLYREGIGFGETGGENREKKGYDLRIKRLTPHKKIVNFCKEERKQPAPDLPECLLPVERVELISLVHGIYHLITEPSSAIIATEAESKKPEKLPTAEVNHKKQDHALRIGKRKYCKEEVNFYEEKDTPDQLKSQPFLQTPKKYLCLLKIMKRAVPPTLFCLGYTWESKEIIRTCTVRQGMAAFPEVIATGNLQTTAATAPRFDDLIKNPAVKFDVKGLDRKQGSGGVVEQISSGLTRARSHGV